MTISKNGKHFYFSSNFKETVKEYYYVDKSLFIKDFLDRLAEVSLITRPRRFGKSLNMDMFRSFFEKTDEDTSVYFKDLKIWKCGEKYTSEQGKYPVIYLDFKDTTGSTWEETYSLIKALVSSEYKRHREAESSLMYDDADVFRKIREKCSDVTDITASLKFLSLALFKHYGVKPIVLIDEYDAPIQYGYDNGYYREIIGFMSNFLTAGLKGNLNVKFALLTGVTRVSKESIFSGLNNIKVYSVTNNEFGEYYGFTKDEVMTVLEDFGAEDKFDEVCEWYDGYLFGKTEIFNPWSVASYVDSGFVPASYWENTSSFGELKTVLKNISEEDERNLELLATGGCVRAVVNDNIPYENLWKGEYVYTMLLSSGYLKRCLLKEEDQAFLKSNEYFLTIPNLEIYDVFCSEILNIVNLRHGDAGKMANDVLERLERGDVKNLQAKLNDFMNKTLSGRDESESFYHGLVTGLIGNLGGNYHMMSNRERGLGYADVTMEAEEDSVGYGMIPRKKVLPAIVMEFKYCKKAAELEQGKMSVDEYDEAREKLLTESAEQALGQIETRKYAEEFQKPGSRTLKYGMAFCRKEVLVLLVENVDGRDVRKVSAKGILSMK